MNFVYMSEPLQKAQPWQILEGKSIVLFYLPNAGNDIAGVQHKLQILEWSLQASCRALQVDALWFKVHVFLFSDAASHSAALEWEEPYKGGSAQIHSITLVDGLTSEHLECLTVHEFAHVVTMNIFGCDIPGFLMEGIAVYAQNAVPETAFVNSGDEPLSITMEESLGALMETIEFDYSHAGAFIGFLVERNGGNLYEVKALCRIIEALHWMPNSIRVDRTIRAIYDLSLEEVEAEWRQVNRNKLTTTAR